MTSVENHHIIQYVPYSSFVHPSFWHTLTEVKLNHDKLNESTKQIFGRYTYRDNIGAVFEVDGTSFNKVPDCELFYINVTGTLMNKNTIEDFKSIDKAALLNSVGEVIWSNIESRTWIDNPSSLLNFFILSFADLKKFHYYFWFAFPSPSQPVLYTNEKSESISTYFNNQQISEISNGYKELEDTQKCFFIITKDGDNVKLHLLSSILKQGIDKNDLDIDLNNTYFVFADPSNNENPGWSSRLFLAALLDYWPKLNSKQFHVIGLRCRKDGSIESSRVFTIMPSQNTGEEKRSGWVGWERNDKGNFGPRLANMSASMDPVKLADTSSDLNIKLMQWRLVPDLNVDIMKNTKCLLLGAGTLGCHVARDLLAWGFRHITFVDSGKVSYSNPTRQILFNFEDCLNGGKKKAEAAAENLKHVLPTVQSQGYAIHIPMPGHPVGETLKEETINNIKTITDAISSHDAIFLLLDTREARWLPTLLAAFYGKIVINAALGFDSYLVMRHGVGMAESDTSANSQFLPGGQLGCYFCNDVTAPGNSLKDRTLDQQCTVTRPGAAAIAAALGVELLVALLQHPLRIEAPAPYIISDDEDSHQGVLGPIPHSIRGFLHSYKTVMPTCAKFKQCIACSDTVLNKYKADGMEFLLNVFNSGKYLEELTGLTELHLSAEMSEILTLSDED